ncbi:MAG: hypothetical protein K2N05_04750 [Muribaculaceae bacterium]|nr:hypothetical protein [Muribaculaceae bacterium]
MKKIFALIVLIIMVMGILPCHSQTASSGLTLDVICKPLSKTGYTAEYFDISNKAWRKLHCMKPDNELNTSLINAGFKCDSKKNTRIFNDRWGEYESYMKAQYSKDTPSGKIYVNTEFDGIHIKFPSATEKKKFITDVKAKGYESYGSGEGYIMPENDEYHWVGIDIRLEGNTVWIVGGGE